MSARIPAAEWQAAKNRQTEAERAKIASWLRIDPTHPQAWYAVLPFARMETDDGPRCAAVLPPALPLGPEGPASVTDDADVFLIAGNGAVVLHRQPGAHLIGTIADGPLFTDGLAFARAWVASRMAFLERLRAAKADYFIDLHEDATGDAPGTLLIGDASRVQWPAGVTFATPDDATAKVINIAIWKAARLSRATSAPTMKATG